MRQKRLIKETILAMLLYFICLAIAVAIDLIFFKVKNMYHTPAMVAIFAGWVYLGLIRKTKQFGAITCLGIFMSVFFFASGHFVLTFLPNLLAGLIADFIAKQGNYENDKFNLLSYMIFSLGNLAPIVTMWIAPKAYIAQLLAKGKTQDYVDQVMVPFTTSHVLILIGGTLMAALIGGYIAKNWLKINSHQSS